VSFRSCSRARPLISRLVISLTALWSATGLTTLNVAAQPLGEPLPVQVIITHMEPRIPQPDGMLQLSGLVINRGNASVSAAEVRLRPHARRLINRSELAAAEFSSHIAEGVPIAGAVASLASPLSPGQSVPWQVTVPVTALEMREAGVYLLGIEVRGNIENGPRQAPVGFTKTFLPWFPTPGQVEPTRLALLWPLVDQPRLDAGGVFINDGLAPQLAGNGRLGKLVTTGRGLPVTWVIDPDLLESARQMTQKYQVCSDNPCTGQPDKIREPARGRETAQQWLGNLRAATTRAEVIPLPYADPDLVALARAGFTEDISFAVTQGQDISTQVLGRALDPVLGWPADGFADLAALTAMRDADISAVVLDERSLPLSSPLTYTPTGRADITLNDQRLPALVADSILSELLGATTQEATPDATILAGQRFLAETAMITMERPSQPRTILVAPPRRWNPDDNVLTVLRQALTEAPWLAGVPLSQLVAEPAADQPKRAAPRYPATAVPELGLDYLERITTMRNDSEAFTSILSQPNKVTGPYGLAALRAESSAWRRPGQPDETYLNIVVASLTTLQDSVRILPRGAIILSSNTGNIPLTIHNGLVQDVNVRLKVRIRPSSRLTIADLPDEETVEAGRNETIQIPARAKANGIAVMEAQLMTPAGQRYGQLTTIRVQATNYARVGQVIAGAAAALLVLAVARRLIRRGKLLRAAPPRNDPTETDDT